MNESKGKINIAQLFMIFALMNGLVDHVVVNPMLLDASGRDAWITVIVTGSLFVVWSSLLYWIMRRFGRQPWQRLVAKQTHPALSWLLTIPVVIVLYGIGATTVVNTVKWNATNYLPATSGMVLVLALATICLILALWGLRTIAITAGILLPLVCVLGVFVSVFNVPQKDHRLLFPVLETGWAPVANGILYAASGFAEAALLVLLQHRLTRSVKWWQLMLYSLFTIMLMLGPVIGAITEFGPGEAANQMTSPYEQWRLVKIGEYVEHVDFFSIFQWLSGACIRISIAVYLLVDVLPLRKKLHRQWAIAVLLLSYIAISLVPINDYSFYRWMYHDYMPIAFFILFTLSILWMGIAMFAKPLPKEG
ncbi:endospore germination permease [Paenibacillus rhizovicinus]|uniref:Endospore germination permease n=1 Tax=Paenibacillus rhizovicinus TaxID=2704463 RepID=A0A6C0NTJ7_9BACL|nr:endospore germination permease [Paenibacillus rhizovicinus]QHW29540.1 endospore germination permease [Paenibacillus rhizovicinus]